jgi:DNA helicase-2/ATP-dependent DNA helicase PcrA
MAASSLPAELLAALDPRQREAVCHGDGPLLIIAGAGTGKTTTLAHRVAHLIATGTHPARILLLTFARRAAAEMVRRVDGILRKANLGATAGSQVWGGTFHSVATRLLRLHGPAIGLGGDFTIHDRPDSEDLLDLLRTDLGLARTDVRFPKKGTCMDIYSRSVNAGERLEGLVDRAFPWCRPHIDDLKRLFQAYVDRKGEQRVLDYDDLLVFFRALLDDPGVGDAVRARFDRVLVDEYQDTNPLQAGIVLGLRPGGQGVTVVGDDAQSIYSFRAATVRNILDFPRDVPGTTIVPLERSFRSTQPLCDATNAVIALSPERHEKSLYAHRAGGGRPTLVSCQDEDEQSTFIVERILEHREAGVDLRRQAVLFRTAHHSLAIEVELGRRQVPFHKYGGLRFIETAHVKDLLAFLRLADNPRDLVAGTRVLCLLPGIGPRAARRLLDPMVAAGSFTALDSVKPPARAQAHWGPLCDLLQGLAGTPDTEVAAAVHRVRSFYAPLCEARYDHSAARLRDLEQLETLAASFTDRRAFASELALDPPSSTQELAGPPSLDDDYLILSTIHSAKGLEWDAVYVLHAADGNIPSDLSTGRADEIEEERRLFYVALTRARDHLYVCFPLRYYDRPAGAGGRHGYAQLTRFLPQPVQGLFEPRLARPRDEATAPPPLQPTLTPTAVRRQLRDLWS